MLRFVAVSLTLLLSLASSATAPEAPTTTTAAEASALAVVNKALLVPLRERDAMQNQMSRAAPRPRQRRARMTSTKPVPDSTGQQFFTFALDQHHGLGGDVNWQKNTLVGCVYPETKTVYVQRGERYFDAGSALGKKSKEAPAHVCVDATPTTTAAEPKT